MSALRIEGLGKRWCEPPIGPIDLSVERGEFLVLFGPEGAGKTAFLRLIAGLETSDQGRVWIGDREVTALPPARRPLAMVQQRPALHPNITVYDNIAAPLCIAGVEPALHRDKVIEAAALMRIDGYLNTLPGELSDTGIQRAALARALVGEPDVFLLDDPLSALEPSSDVREELSQQFHQLPKFRSAAIIYTTRSHTEALRFGDRIGVMHAGRLLQIDTAREVFERPLDRTVAESLGVPRINLFTVQILRERERVIAASLNSKLYFDVAPEHGTALLESGRASFDVGIRPHHLEVLDEDSGYTDRPVLPAKVLEIMAFGNLDIMSVDLFGERLTVLSANEPRFRRGDSLSLALNVYRFLYFDPTNGVNLMR